MSGEEKCVKPENEEKFCILAVLRIRRYTSLRSVRFTPFFIRSSRRRVIYYVTTRNRCCNNSKWKIFCLLSLRCLHCMCVRSVVSISGYRNETADGRKWKSKVFVRVNKERRRRHCYFLISNNKQEYLYFHQCSTITFFYYYVESYGIDRCISVVQTTSIK